MTKHSHEKLNLSFKEYGALLGTETMMGLHTLVPAPARGIGALHGFDMHTGCVTNAECGSVSCIGGTMALIMGMTDREARDYVGSHDPGGFSENRSKPIARLFFPNVTVNGDWAWITPKIAKEAIRRWRRSGGKINWMKLVPKRLAKKARIDPDYHYE